jgi:hypothetical protein
MTLDEIRTRVSQLSSFDSEVAHSSEDALYVDVLKALADGSLESPQEAARICLQSQELPFDRWCA